MSNVPIWAEPPPGSRKPRFTREQIAQVAVAIADHEGFEAVSMRRIADELGAGTMTLYYYVRTKDDLLTIIDEALMGEAITLSMPLPRGWRAAVETIARATHATYTAHPWAIASLDRARVGPNGLRHIEHSLSAVAELPLSMLEKVQLLTLVDDYVFGSVQRSVEDHSSYDQARAVNDLAKSQLATGAYPQLAELVGSRQPAEVFFEISETFATSDRFELGLQAMLDGLTVRLGLDAASPGQAKRAKEQKAREAKRAREFADRQTHRAKVDADRQAHRAKARAAREAHRAKARRSRAR